jgi:periplasmic protein TonB
MNAMNSRTLLVPPQLHSQRGLYKSAAMAFAMHLLALIGVAGAAHFASKIEFNEINTITATLHSSPSVATSLEKPVWPTKSSKPKLETPVNKAAQALQASKPAAEREILTTSSSAIETAAFASNTVAVQPTASSAVAVQAKVEIPVAAAQPVVNTPAIREAITPAIFDAAYLNNPPPQYPAVSRLRGETGTAYLRVQISAEGKAIDVNVSQSSGSSKLDQAAVSAVSKWRFVPAKRAGVTMTSWVTIPIEYTLNQ